MSSNYPAGAEYSPKAPWNEGENSDREVEVTVSITLSKTMTVRVNDYNLEWVGKDEDGDVVEDIDFSCCNLKEAINQHYLPHEAYRFVDAKDIKEDLKDWNVDDLEVILE